MEEIIAHSNAAALARRFQRFAKAECRGSSDLYEQLALSLATDGEVLGLAAHAAKGQPVPNLLFAAVHLLLLKGYGDALAQFYPNLTTAPRAPVSAYPAFRAFCLDHEATIRDIITTRRVQTNEVGRCAYLFPAFACVGKLAAGRPLAFIEIGTSAGLNLMWDHYGYRYGEHAVYGNPRSSVQIACVLRGDIRPPLFERLPKIALRVGVDLHVVDIRDEEEALWLRALIWPEHKERAMLLRNAVEISRRSPPQLLEGDGVVLLPELLRAVPDKAAVCVFHTHTINQLAADARERLSTLLAAHAITRDIYRISGEWIGTAYPQLELTEWQNGRATQRLLANCDPHGRWIEWLDDGS